MECNSYIEFHDEMWEYSFKFLSEAKDFASASQVCKRWNSMLKGESFWNNILVHFGTEIQKPFLNSWHEHYKIGVRKQKGSLWVKHYNYPSSEKVENSLSDFCDDFSFTEEGHILRMYGFITKRDLKGGYPVDGTGFRGLSQRNLMSAELKEIEPKQQNNPALFQRACSYPFVALRTFDHDKSSSNPYQIKLIHTETNVSCIIPLSIEWTNKQQFLLFIHCDSDQLYVASNCKDKDFINCWDIDASPNQISLGKHSCFEFPLADPIEDCFSIPHTESMRGMQSNQRYLLISSKRITIVKKETQEIIHLTDPKDFRLDTIFASYHISLYQQKCAALSIDGELRVWALGENEDKLSFRRKFPIFELVKIILHEDIVFVGYNIDRNCGKIEVWNHKTCEKVMEQSIEHRFSTMDADEGRIVVSNSKEMTILDFSSNPIALHPDYALLSETKGKLKERPKTTE